MKEQPRHKGQNEKGKAEEHIQERHLKASVSLTQIITKVAAAGACEGS